MHPVAGPEFVQAGNRRPDRDRAGADDQLVVTDHVVGSVPAGDQQLAGVRIDPAGRGVQPQAHPGCSSGPGAVGQVLPAGYFTGDVVGDAAD